MPHDAGALQKLTNLVTQSTRELEEIKKSLQEFSHVDTALAHQAVKTLHSIVGLAQICNLNKAADIAQKLESLIQQIIQNRLTPDNKLLTLIEQASTLLFSILYHGQDALEQTMLPILKELNIMTQTNHSEGKIEQIKLSDPPRLHHGHTTKELLEKCDLISCGITLADMVQLGETEKKMIINLYENNEPIIGYLVHTQLKELEQTIITIEQKISHEHSLISIIPTQSKNPIHHYAFLFIFTTQQNLDEIKKLLTFPGTITWIQKNQPLQTMTLT